MDSSDLANNIDIVQINIQQDVGDYYLPKNVNWRKKKVDKLVIALSPYNVSMLSPIDGQTPVLSSVQNLYIDLYANDDTQIVRNLSYENLLHTNNNVLPIGQALSLNMCRLHFTTLPKQAGCVLLYVYYDGRVVEDAEPANKSITVRVPLAPNSKMSLQDIVDNYIYMQPDKVKGLYVWEAEQEPCYITLRDNDGKRTLNSIYSGLCRPPMQAAGCSATDTQIYEMLLDNINIDMLNSFVQNAVNTEVVKEITFLY